jgi:hypothetical protein
MLKGEIKALGTKIFKKYNSFEFHVIKTLKISRPTVFQKNVVFPGFCSLASAGENFFAVWL